MKTLSESKKKELLKQETDYLNSLKGELRLIYLSVKDFNVDAIATQKAIEKMNSLNTKIKAAKRKILNIENK